MNCKDVISAIENNEKDVDSFEFRSHLKECHYCNDFYITIKSIDEVCFSDVEVPQSLPMKIIDKVNFYDKKEKKHFLWSIISGVAAAILIGFFVGSMFIQKDVEPNTETIEIDTQYDYLAQTTDMFFYDSYILEGD